MKPTRSASFPLESNPIMLKITSEINRLKAWEESSTSTAETIGIGLFGVTDLYECIIDFLRLPFIQQSISLHHNDNCLMELLDGSKKIVDICSATREITERMKDASKHLITSLQGKNNQASSISAFFSSRKQIIKTVKKTLLLLKGVELDSFRSSQTMLDDDQGVSAVIKVLTCVNIISISILETLLFFLATSVSKCKSAGRFSFAPKLMSRSKVACEGQDTHQSKNELINLNSALFALLSQEAMKEMNIQVASKRLSSLDAGLEGILNGTDSMSKQLIGTRSTLLMIFSS